MKAGGRENGLKCPHYLIDYEGGGGGGWRINLEFCLHLIFVVTLEFRPYANKGDYCTNKILVIYQQNMENNCVFPIYPKLRKFRLAWPN